jgi:hypothetical protein
MAEHVTACLEAWGGATPWVRSIRQKEGALPGASRSPRQPQDRRRCPREEGVPNHAYLLCQHRHPSWPWPQTSRRTRPQGRSAGMSWISRWSGQPLRQANYVPPLPLPILERITIPLIEKAADDLRITHDRTGLSIIDIVNRAISLYEFVDAELRVQAELIVRRDGKDRLIKLL